jgi:hypothetical protein
MGNEPTAFAESVALVGEDGHGHGGDEMLDWSPRVTNGEWEDESEKGGG